MPLAAVLLLAAGAARGRPDAIPLTATLAENGGEPQAALDLPASFPGQVSATLHASTSWVHAAALTFDVCCPPDAPTNVQLMVYLQDWDYWWYQNLLPDRLVPGETNRFRVSFSSGAGGWVPKGHHAAWHYRALMAPETVGIRIFGASPYEGVFRLARPAIEPDQDRDPPFIRNVVCNTNRVPCFGKFEITFHAPDRYPNPFDPERVSVTADFETPDGRTVTADGFYARSYYRITDPAGARLIPQGSPFWCVRFAPCREGEYRYRLKIRDAFGSAEWGPAAFRATPPRSHGFVRVSQTDPRYFEFDDDTYFFPIGHNIRSAHDARMEEQFPWAQRWPEGTTAYARYFRAMGEHGENLAEIWSAAWSLGLEWSPVRPGYHGIGQFNLMHAWEMDRVLEDAAANGVYLNFVVHNHGKFSDYIDEEWDFNPLNRKNGGFLDGPFEYFTDPGAHAAFLKLMRYIIARWGYSPHVFAWELWSELDLTGSKPQSFKAQHQPEVVEWHRAIGREVKELDPYDHLITTHVSGDYGKQNPAISSLPGIDFCAVDAYHGSPDPLQIVDLLRRTAAHNARFRKPVLVTEFGGSHMAQELHHLENTLHAALWASACTGVGGTPLFWWWQLVEEENLYPKYGAVSRFMAGEDRRNPAMQAALPRLTGDPPATRLASQCLKDRSHALGWIYRTRSFEAADPTDTGSLSGLALTLTDMDDGEYQVQFWDTVAGRPVADVHAAAEKGSLTVAVPPFARDIAFKVKPDP